MELSPFITNQFKRSHREIVGSYVLAILKEIVKLYIEPHARKRFLKFFCQRVERFYFTLVEAVKH